MESKTAPDIIKQAIDNEWFHVFFTVSPVTSIIFRMIAEKYLLPKEKIIVFSFRDNDTRIIDFKVYDITVKHYKYFKNIMG